MTIEQTSSIKSRCEALIHQLRLPADFYSIIDDIYLPLSSVILDKKSDRPLFVSINGVQGSGKSTMTQFLKLILETELQAEVAVLSLDDFYLTRQHRNRLAEQLHPLLMTRGVPGTHDVDMLEQVLYSLIGQEKCLIPVFDKAADDVCDSSRWITIDDPVQIILFEGWCNNSPVQNAEELAEPINELERKYDADGVWRNYVNQKLQEYHDRVFGRSDLCVMLKPPNFECVYRWRSLQEQKLRQAAEQSSRAGEMPEKIMDEAQLNHFIQHFERISRHTLEHLPQLADVVIPINEDHRLTEIRLNTK